MNKTITLFFDFYALNLLDFFAGEKTLNHSNRAERISNRYTEVTEELYEEIYRALMYSVVREFRHFYWETPHPGSDEALEKYKHLMKVSQRIYSSYNSNRLNRWLKNKNTIKFPIKIDLDDLAYGYNRVQWNKCYGGKNWGKAVEFLQNLPTTVEQKQLWIDRVLDLQHNTGHILNKTDFYSLSKPKQCHRHNESNRRKKTALNYRRYATGVTDLIRYSSSSVKKLSIANMNYVPKQIQ